ncbi:MAG: hypothetical protein PHT16_02020 [Candidatus Pacebacteria bacterium]|nr:hypothetical protein [Candidatus Paceibacterota bacterium]
MSEEDKKSDWFLWLIGISCLVAILVSFYFFYFKKDYDFIVEVACDPSVEICFQRDCSNPDDCPPNELSDFKRFSLKASDFKMCENEDCANACEAGTIKCEPIECEEDEEMGESCSVLELPVAEEE